MNILEIAETIKENGGEIYLVGGAVRDELLNRKSEDEDYCVVGLSLEEFKNLFPIAKEKGRAFPVFELDKKEFALARKDIKIEEGHKGFRVKFRKDTTILEDLQRRDITINSMAKNVLTGEIIDPFNAKEDIKRKIIKATSKAFKEDPLRIYRVARFASQLQFEVEEKTIEQMKLGKLELKSLPKERVFKELYKALASEKPSIFFEILRKSDVLDVHFKEIQDLIGVLQPEKYHPEGDAFNHTMLVLDYCAKQTNLLNVRYSALVHDLGKGITPKEKYPHHYGHDEKGVIVVERLSKRIGVPTLWEASGKTVAKEHMRGGIFGKMTPNKQVSFVEKISKTKLGLDGLQIVVKSDLRR